MIFIKQLWTSSNVLLVIWLYSYLPTKLSSEGQGLCPVEHNAYYTTDAQ